jgi:endonuclease/exonuclease/phosphatase family metal-dependent hydrolase
MPNYRGINPNTEEGRRIADRLLKLRRAIRKSGIPSSKRDSNLIVATWNLREFGKGARSDEAIHYIAEIISRFDVLALQEVRGDLHDFHRLLEILGGWWKYLLTDITLGHQGNDERLAFLYNSRKVDFGGFVGQVIIPAVEEKKRKKEGDLPKAYAFSRTPLQVGFSSGWFKFQICTTHAYYGKDKPDDPQRKAELEQLAHHLIERANDDQRQRAWARHFMLLGDFNIFTNEDASKAILQKAGLTFPDQLAGQVSGYGQQERHYDQIAFYTPGEMYGGRLAGAAMGAFDFFDVVYRDDGEDEKLYPASKHDARGFRQWRTYQMSDHKPLWIAFATDSADAYLWALSKGRPQANQGDLKEIDKEEE